MNLTEMEERVIEAAKYSKHSDTVSSDLEVRITNTSYYKDYQSCKHMSDSIVEYDFDSPVTIRRYLDELWNDDPELKAIVIETLMLMRKSGEHLLEQVSVYNYMM